MTSPSDVPVRAPGTRARSGNAMGRTRTALLQATADCVARYGIRKTTMVDVASRSGVAKATLYNHFRTKDDVLAALVEQAVAELLAACISTASAEGLEAALTRAALALTGSAPLRKAVEEPALIAALAVPDEGRTWQQAREGVAAVLAAGRAPAGPDTVDLVLRWAVSQILWPMTGDQAREGAAALVRGLDTSAPVARIASLEPPPEVAVATSVAGLGWPA